MVTLFNRTKYFFIIKSRFKAFRKPASSHRAAYFPILSALRASELQTTHHFVIPRKQRGEGKRRDRFGFANFANFAILKIFATN